MRFMKFIKKGRLLILLFSFLLSTILLAPAFAQPTYSLTLVLKKGSVSLGNLQNIEQFLYQVPGNWGNDAIITNIVLPLYGGSAPTHADIDTLTLSKVGTTRYDPPNDIPFRFQWTGSDFVITTAGDPFGTGLEVDINGLKLGKKLVPVIASSNYYVILTTYSIPSSADVLGMKVGETWTWAGNELIAGAPLAPTVTNATNNVVNEANIGLGEAFLELGYTAGYAYSGIELEVVNVDTVASTGQPSTKMIGQIATGGDHLDLLAGTTYTLRTRGNNLFGTSPTDNVYTFQTKSAVGALPYTLALESQVPDPTPGLGINAFGMPFSAPWYAFQSDGITVIDVGDGSNQIENAYELVRAINAAAGGNNVVSTFGRWNKIDQIEDGIMILNEDPEPVRSDLEIRSLVQGLGYQVYVTQDVQLVIRSTETP